MSKPKAPEPPSAKDTASAANSTNLSTAIANAFMGNVNQVTPDGTLTFDQTGTHQWYDPFTKKTYDVPTFTATQELSEDQQAIQDQSRGAELNMATLANQQSSFLKDYMAEPVDLSSDNVRNYVNDHYLDDFTSEWDTQRSDLETRLANQGIGIGSDAYTRAMSDFSQNRSGARDNLYGNMYAGAQQAITAERNQPLNEITALLSGSQVSQPSFVNANMPGIPTTDVAGLINTNYNQKLANWQSDVNQRQNLMGGLFGLAGNLGSAAIMSDRNAKKNVKEVGELKGHKLYEYDYKKKTGIPGKHIGVMAQDVEKKKPEAVSERPDGYKQVHYGKLFGMGA